MTLYDQIRAEKLIKLARERFDPNLLYAEVKVLRDSSSSAPLAIPPEIGPRPQVRPSLVRWLVTDPEARSCIDAQGLRVMGCTITGHLNLTECRNLPSLWLLRCEIKGMVSLQAAETSGIYFMYSSIEGGISAARIVVRGPIYLTGLRSPKEIRLLGAKIDSQLVLTGAKLIQQDTAARSDGMLVLDGAKIGDDVLLNEEFECTGPLRLPGSSITGQLNFIGATVDAVYCNDLQLDGELLWCGVSKTENTELSLTGANIRVLSDDQDSWPEQEKLNLLGLVYEDLILHAKQTEEQQLNNWHGASLPLNASQRVEWLKRQKSEIRIHPQPWMQLRNHLEIKGDKSGAKHVIYKLSCLRAGLLKWHPNRTAAIAFAWLEERPSRILYSIALTLLLGTLIFAGAGPNRSGAMVPTAKDSAGRPISGAALAYYPRYEPFVYTLDNALPLVKLGMDDKWTPDPNHGGDGWFPEYRWLDWLGWFNSYWFLTVSRWLLILSGWFQAAVLGAALTSRFKS